MTALDANDLCAGCGTEIGRGVLVCPACNRLVHATQLQELASKAEFAKQANDGLTEIECWRSALELLPSRSNQVQQIRLKIEVLTANPALAKPKSKIPNWAKSGGAIGAMGLLIWKFKVVIVFAFTKLKFLALGLSKSSTLFSMIASLGVYWAAWGWKFAAGLIALLYVHEMGHVAELKRRGFPASAPMFIPGFGAVVRLHQRPNSPVEDARIGLAGPIWGMAAAIVCWGIWKVTDIAMVGAIAQVGGWLNVFNLMPVWQLDGSRAFAALARRDRIVVAVGFVAAFLFAQEGLFALIALVAVWRCFTKAPAIGDRVTLYQFWGLIIVGTLLGSIPVTV